MDYKCGDEAMYSHINVKKLHDSGSGGYVPRDIIDPSIFFWSLTCAPKSMLTAVYATPEKHAVGSTRWEVLSTEQNTTMGDK